MKYTFINEQGQQQTVEIPDDYIKKNKRNLGLTNKEAIEMYLSDEGYIDNSIVEKLSAKAKNNKDKVQRGTRKAPNRKPDYTKRAVIDAVYNFLCDTSIEGAAVRNPSIENVERIIAFTIGNDNYELTLSKKRQPKK